MKRANKRKKNSKIKSLVLLLFLTIVMLSTATYAWFTSNRTVSINTINVNVAATSGLQISADAITWKSVLSNDDLKNASNTYGGADNHIVAEMSPVSTAGTVASGLLKMYSGTVEGDSGGNMALTTAALTDASGKYVVFDIFLKVDTGGTVYLQAGSGTTVKSGETSKGLENAARYAFLVEGNGSSTATSSSLQSLMTGTSSTLTIVEPNYDAHTATGVSNAVTYYNFPSTGTGSISAGTSSSPVNYYGVDGAVTNIALTSTNPPGLSGVVTGQFDQKWGTIFKTNTAFSTAATGFGYISGTGTSATTNHYPALLSLQAGVTKVRVYMWVEGQDVDCENNASGTNLSYTIYLTLDDYGTNNG